MTRIHFLALAAITPVSAADPITLADFEGGSFGNWKVVGNAFGDAPATGTLPGQMEVSGFTGNGLANSYHGGDDSTGSLTSPPFTIGHNHLNFLIGGGKFPGETCINLIIGGEIVRTATGPNDTPGGTERLSPFTWDVAEFRGKPATLRPLEIIGPHLHRHGRCSGPDRW